MRKMQQRNLHYLQLHPLGVISGMLLRNNTTLLEVMTTYIKYGPHYGKKGTKLCHISPISSIPCTPRLVSNTLSDIWCSSTTVVLLLVVEPDYLPDAEVLCFQPCLYPMKYLHPRSMYTLPRGGVQRGGTPSAGSGGSIPPAGGSGGKWAPSGGSGAKPPKQKLPYKSIL
jgi:hypothetical protein